MVNQVVLIGRIARDLELRSTQNGREVLNFTVAVNRNFKNQATGEYDADFINCVAFNQTAKFMSSYLQKGNLISVTGRIQTRSYDNNAGQRVYVTEIVADSVNGLERRSDANNNSYNNNSSYNNNNSYNNNYQNNSQSQNNMSPQDFMQNEISSKPSYAMDDINDDDLPF